MKKIELVVKSREKSGSSNSKRFRREGLLPASISYPDASSKSCLLNENEFVKLAKTSHYTDQILIKSEDKAFDGMKVLVKDVQLEPIKSRVLHVDFQALQDNVPVRVKVPVHLEGTPEGTVTQGGILTQSSQRIVVMCLPKNIPSSVTVDVSKLMVGDRILAEQVELPEGIELKSSAGETVAAVVSSRTTRLQEAADLSVSDTEVEGEEAIEGTSEEPADKE